MAKLRRFLLWATLDLIVALIVLSIYGAFIGADRAKGFFNSLPLAVYWVLFLLTLVAGFYAFKRLRSAPSSFCIHAGCVAVLIGGFWGSRTGQNLQRQWLGQEIIPEGQMLLMDGQQERQVYINTDPEIMGKWRVYIEPDPNNLGRPRVYMNTKPAYKRELPFEIVLDRFRMEFYPGKLYVQNLDTRKQWDFPVEAGAVYDLGPPHGQIKIARVFENFKVSLEESEEMDDDGRPKRTTRIFDDPGPGSNRALEVHIAGEVRPRYVFEQNAGHTTPDSPLGLIYRSGMVSDYISEVKVLVDGEVVKRKNIEVNYPLYYGGYHFYQSSYGGDERSGGMYTVLSVVPYTGLYWVYLGYILLCLGVAWQCWLLSIRKTLKQEER